MNYDKESKSKIFFFFLGGGGGGLSVAWGYEHKSHPIFYTRHIVTASSTELYSLVKIFLMVFKIEGTVALKVGSCPSDDNSVKILFCPFLCSI